MDKQHRALLRQAMRDCKTTSLAVEKVHAAHDYRRCNLVVALDHLSKVEAALRAAAVEA